MLGVLSCLGQLISEITALVLHSIRVGGEKTEPNCSYIQNNFLCGFNVH